MRVHLAHPRLDRLAPYSEIRAERGVDRSPEVELRSPAEAAAISFVQPRAAWNDSRKDEFAYLLQGGP